MNKLVKYLKESREEFKKVTWPTRKETINYSLLVVAISFLIAFFIGFADYVLNVGVESIINATGVTSAPSISIPSDGVVGEPVTVTPPDVQLGDIQVGTADGGVVDATTSNGDTNN